MAFIPDFPPEKHTTGNSISAGGEASDGTYIPLDDGGIGGLIKAALLNADGGEVPDPFIDDTSVGAGGEAGDGAHMPIDDGDIGGLIKAALLNGAGSGDFVSQSIGNDAGGGSDTYDGHVPLTGTEHLLPDIGTALDLLTTSHHLFDVPAIDLDQGLGDLDS